MLTRYSRLPAAALLGLVLTTTACTGGGATGPAPDATATGAPEAVVVTPGPPPPPGATGEPAVGVSSLAPVPVGEPAAFGGGLVATVSTIDPVDVAAQGPGQIAGPGVAVTVELRNESADPIDVGGVVVNAYYGPDATPANASDSAPAAPATGSLPAGEARTGVYVFQVPREDAASLTVEINYSGSPNVVLVRR